MNFAVPALVTRWRTHCAVWFARLSPAGVAFGVFTWCVSLAPSLVPRSWVFQGVLSGVSIILAYAFGASVGGFMRWLGFDTPWPGRVTRILWRVFLPIAAFSIVASAYFGADFQTRLRILFEMPGNSPYMFIGQAIIAFSLAIVVLSLSRLLRRIGNWVAAKLGRWFPRRAAILASALIVAVAVLMLVDGTLVRGSMNALNSMYATSDKEYAGNVEQPTRDTRSGSPASLSSWDSLGKMGREFVSGGPSVDDLQALADQTKSLAGREARDPIRVYAGLGQEHDLDATAQQVIAELDRTNAWDRKALLVATATGTGWIDPAASTTFEYLNAGDTAIASMQYSYLPSWVSFLSDRGTPPQAGKALFEAVYAAWLEKPEDSRPKLYVYGLSLGSYGMQGAFSGLQDLNERTDGAVFVGTPSFTDHWRYFTERRDPGSQQIAPVFDGGKQVRFSASPDDASGLWDIAPVWKDPKVVYVQHASDAVTWWSPELIWNAPDWIDEEPAVDRPMTMRWYPIVTFLQVTFDMFVAGDVPPGHGHMYLREYVDAFAAVTQESRWDTADIDLVKEWVALGPHPESTQEQGR